MRSIRRFVAIGLALGWVIAAAGCEKEGTAHGGPPGQGHEGPGGDGQRKLPTLPVAVESAVRGTIASYYSATATLDPNKEADVVARVSGTVLELLAEEGDHVRHDQVLLRVDDEEYAYRLKQAEAAEEKQQSRFQRAKEMHSRELVSGEAFDDTRTDLLSAEASRELAALELSHTEIRAPFDGRVTTRAVDPGEMVSSGTVLFTVADLSRLLARVHVPARAFRRIQTDQTVELIVDSSQDTLRGKITLISPIVDPASGTIKITVEVRDYPPTTRPGDFAQVRIVTEQHANTVLVPRNAVVSEKGEQVVYVVADSTAQRRLVAVGFQDKERAEITSGVESGERVVVQGQRSLRDGQPIKIMERSDSGAES